MARFVFVVFFLLVGLLSASALLSTELWAQSKDELIELEQADPSGFWKTAPPEQITLLVSDAKPEDWPIFATGDKDWQKG